MQTSVSPRLRPSPTSDHSITTSRAGKPSGPRSNTGFSGSIPAARRPFLRLFWPACIPMTPRRPDRLSRPPWPPGLTSSMNTAFCCPMAVSAGSGTWPARATMRGARSFVSPAPPWTSLRKSSPSLPCRRSATGWRPSLTALPMRSGSSIGRAVSCSPMPPPARPLPWRTSPTNRSWRSPRAWKS